MRDAEVREGKERKEEQEKKLKDLSEWKLPNSQQIVSSIGKRHQKLQIVGYTSINSRPAAGRMVYSAGVEKDKPKSESEGEASEEDEAPKEESAREDPKPSRKEASADETKTLLQLWNERKNRPSRGINKPKRKGHKAHRKHQD